MCWRITCPKSARSANVITGRRLDVGDASDTGSEEKFLDRWSRRKQAGQQPASTATGQPEQEAVPAVDEAPRQELTDADMPPVDTLDSDSDFSVFMSPGVSEQLRTQALRKLFHLPAFNVTDGLNDYDEDYTQFTGLGKVVTQEMQRMLKRELARKDEVKSDEQQQEPAIHDDEADDSDDQPPQV
jgi:hypothetical protein